MSEEDLLQSAKTVIHSLDTLKHEHEKLLASPLQPADAVDLLRKSLDVIELGIDEGQVMIELGHHVDHCEAEKQKLRTQVKRLCQENAWLRDELGSTQKKLHQCEEVNASYSVEIEHLRFLKEMQQCGINDEPQQESDAQDLVNDLFPSDENEEKSDNYPSDTSRMIDSQADLSASSSSSKCASSSFVSTNGYELPARLKTLHNLVVQYASQGRYEVAVPLCRQALDDLEKALGHDHPDVATMLNILALVYRDQSKYEEATVLLHDALAIRENTLGPDHPAVAATANNLAVLYGKRHKFKEAEPLCKRALDIREKFLGPSHPDIAKQLNNLALICQNQEKYDDVEKYYTRAIDIYTRNVGPNDAHTIKTKNNLASVYLHQQKYEQAEELYKSLLLGAPANARLPSRRESRANDEPTVDLSTVTNALKNLSQLYRRQGRYDAADTMDNCASRARKDPQAILHALSLVQ